MLLNFLTNFSKAKSGFKKGFKIQKDKNVNLKALDNSVTVTIEIHKDDIITSENYFMVNGNGPIESKNGPIESKNGLIESKNGLIESKNGPIEGEIYNLIYKGVNSRIDIAKELDKSDRTVKRILKRMCEEGTIVRVGAGPKTHYKIK